jgi:hypothetical protein
MGQGWACRLRFHADGEDIHTLARSPEHLLKISDVVLRLLAANVLHSVILDRWYGALISAPSLAYLEQCQSLKALTLEYLEMDENHCRALGAYSRSGLEVVLIRCKLTSAETSSLVEVLGRNQGPTKLDDCDIDNVVIADGLRGNNRLKVFRPMISSISVGNQNLLPIAGALRENKGLVELDLRYFFRVSDETWGAVCDSLKTHPTLEVLNLCPIYNDATMAPAVVKSRIQALLDMMKGNMSIHTIHLRYHYSERELFRASVIPYLETNRLRPRVRAIQKTRPIPYRAMLLGRALLAVRTDPNRFWMLLSGNADVAFQSLATMLATDLPTPTTAVATSNAAAVAATDTAAWTASAAAAHGATLTACQKHKTCS